MVNEPEELKRSRLRLWGLVDAGMTMVGAACLLGLLGSFWWGFDLLTHFRLQYALLLVPGVIAYGVGHKWRRLAVGMTLLGWQVACIAPLYWGETSAAPTTGSYRVVLVNVYTGNQHPEQVTAFLREVKPDIVVLEEISPTWMTILETLHEEFPYHVEHPQSDNFGIGVYSRFPLDGQLVEIGDAGVTSIVATVDLEGEPLTVVATHPVPPVGAVYSGYRDGQLAELGDLAARTEGAVMVIGDLNTTGWSGAFKQLLRKSGLRDSRRGFGIQRSWPSEMPWMRIPLDHVLVSSQLTIHKRQIGPPVGSDHLPVIVDFSLAKRARSH